MDGGDDPAVAVLDPSLLGGQPPVVLPGHDLVPDTGALLAGERNSPLGDQAGVDPVLARAAVQRGDGVRVGGDHQRRQTFLDVGFPRRIHLRDQLLLVSADHPAVALVDLDHVLMALPEPQRCFLLPLVGEAVNPLQLGCPVVSVAD